ncbi:MAG TPA: hypothetical protein VIL69_13750 [Roseomonas sp.]|jgi:hypothetical protein
MSNGGPEFRAALTALGFSEARAEATIRYLGENGEVLRGGRGRRRKDDRAWAARDYAVTILGLGAIKPIDAPSVARALGELRHTASSLHTTIRNDVGEVTAIQQVPDRIVDVSLRSVLAAQMELLAENTTEERQVLRQAAQGLFIRLDADRLEASVPFQFAGDVWGLDQFGPPQPNLLLPEPPRLSWGFEVKLEIEIVFIAADLLAETRAQRNGGLLPPKGEEPTSNSDPKDGAHHEYNDASDPGRSEASSCARDGTTQSHLTHASRPSDSLHGKENGNFAQSRISVSGWSPEIARQRTTPKCPPLMA